jgi:hypothetical protein
MERPPNITRFLYSPSTRMLGRPKLDLRFDFVRAAEQIVNICEVVCAWEKGVCGAGWGIALLEMSVLAEIAHLISN